MNRLWKWFELPLLTRELSQLASKKRTYATRVLYAGLLCALMLMFFSDSRFSFDANAGPYALMGAGQMLFAALLLSQLLGVHLLMPAIGSAAITLEKERNMLGLLFVTRLGPWRILFEKLLSRLVPMLACLLMSVPALALAYSFGGLDFNQMVNGIWLLFVTAIQIAAMTLMCSSFFRTTAQSFIAAYVLQMVIFVPTLFRLLSARWSFVMAAGPMTRVPAEFYDEMHSWFCGTSLWITHGRLPFSRVAGVESIGLYISTLVFFALARLFLIRRSSVRGRSVVMAIFRRLDGFFVRLNNRVAGGVVLSKEKSVLPGDDPVAWRETTKKSLGTVRYLVRILLVLEFPTLFICVMATTVSRFSYDSYGLWILQVLLWLISGLTIALRCATLVASERSAETLDVLLASPLSGREILLQKCAGLRRLLVVLAVPLLTTIWFEAYMRGFRPTLGGWYYPLWGTGCVAVYLPTMAWLSMLVGLRIRSQSRSVFAAMAVLVTWTVLPWLVLQASVWLGGSGSSFDSRTGEIVLNPLWLVILWSGPSSGLLINQSGVESLMIPLTHLAFFVLFCWLLRRFVLRRSSRWLGRLENDQSSTDGEGEATPRRIEPAAETTRLVQGRVT